MAGKLNLDVDQLQVESFDAEARGRTPRGTIRGHDLDANTIDTCYDYTCRGYGTCGIYPCKQVP